MLVSHNKLLSVRNTRDVISWEISFLSLDVPIPGLDQVLILGEYLSVMAGLLSLCLTLLDLLLLVDQLGSGKVYSLADTPISRCSGDCLLWEKCQPHRLFVAVFFPMVIAARCRG